MFFQTRPEDEITLSRPVATRMMPQATAPYYLKRWTRVKQFLWEFGRRTLFFHIIMSFRIGIMHERHRQFLVLQRPTADVAISVHSVIVWPHDFSIRTYRKNSRNVVVEHNSRDATMNSAVAHKAATIFHGRLWGPAKLPRYRVRGHPLGAKSARVLIRPLQNHNRHTERN